MPATATDDRMEIEQLITRYYHAIDQSDFEGWADCFTEHGRFEGAFASYDAHADLDRFRADSLKLETNWPALRHQATPPLIELNGDTARAESNFMMTSVSGPAGQQEPIVHVVMAGMYQDELRRTPAGWRFHIKRSLPDPQVSAQR